MSHPVCDNYADLFRDERKRCNKKKFLNEYLESTKSAEDFGSSNFTSMLSVGPGFGDLDTLVIGQCPNLKDYIALEPESDFHGPLKDTLASHDSVKKTFLVSTFEDYNGSNFDAVFLMHSTYYFYDGMELQLRRAYDMLKKNGKMVIMVGHPEPLFEICAKICERSESSYKECKDAVKKIDDQYKEIILDMELDFSDPGPMNHSLVDLTIQRKATAEEKAMVLEEFSKHFVPGTKVVKTKESVFVLTKH